METLCVPPVSGSSQTSSTSGADVADAASKTPLVPGQNFADFDDAPTARTNLGLGTAATSATTDFVAASAVSTFVGTLIDSCHHIFTNRQSKTILCPCET